MAALDIKNNLIQSMSSLQDDGGYFPPSSCNQPKPASNSALATPKASFTLLASRPPA
jgi:hypothetical protein